MLGKRSMCLANECKDHKTNICNHVHLLINLHQSAGENHAERLSIRVKSACNFNLRSGFKDQVTE